MLRVFAILFMLVAAGCQGTIVDQVGPLNITSVTVRQSPDVVASSNIRAKVQREADDLLLNVNPGGTPVRAIIDVDKLQYKNRGLALIVPSQNNIEAAVELRDRNNRPVSSFRVAAQSDLAYPGAIGVVTRTNRPLPDLDTALARNLAGATLYRIYRRAPMPSPNVPLF